MINGGQKLRAAILEKDQVKIKELLKNGADPNAVIPGEDFAAIHLGAGTTKSITQLLLKHGANPNQQTSEGSTPLHIAASWGKSDILKVLLKYGADETIWDNENLAAIEVAQNYEYWDCINIIRKRSKKRLGNQWETEKKKHSLHQSIVSPAQVQVNVHREHIDVFTELIDKRSDGWNIDNSHGHDRTRSLPLMSAIFSLPRQKGSFYNKENDSVTSNESPTLSSPVKRKIYLTAGSVEHNWGNPDSDDFVSVDPSLNTNVNEGSIQAENVAEIVEIGSMKINHQNGFHIENNCETQQNSKHSKAKSKSRTFSDPNNQNKDVGDTNNCISIDQCSSVETEKHSNSARHLKYLIRPESVDKYIVKNDTTESDDSTVKVDTVSTIISTVPNDVYSQCGSEPRLCTENLKSHQRDHYVLERKEQNRFRHHEELEDQVKHGQQPSAKNFRTNKKSDFRSAKKTESKCQESLDDHCFCNKHLQIKIDLRFGPLKSKAQKPRDSSSTKCNISARSQNSTFHDVMNLRCSDKATGNIPRVANITVQPSNIYCETINNEMYKPATDDPAVKVHGSSRHDLHCANSNKNATKQKGNDAPLTERTQERSGADVSENFSKKDSREACPPHLVREESKTQRTLLKDKLLKDLKNHLHIS